LRLELGGPGIVEKLCNATINTRNFQLYLFSQALELFLLLGIGRRECRPQMIEGQVNVIQRVPDFMRDRGR
jgi:hypothetical protein